MAKSNPIATSQYKTKPADSATEGHNIQLLPTRWYRQFKNKIQDLLYLLSWSLMWPVVKVGDSNLNVIPCPCSRNYSSVFGGRFRGNSPLAKVLPVSFSSGLPTPTTLHIITGKRRWELNKLLITLFHHRNSGCCFQFWPQRWKQRLVSWITHEIQTTCSGFRYQINWK